MEDEVLEIVDEEGQVTGTASRVALHSDNTLLHRVVHVLVVNARGDILLQKRSEAKDVAPGKWDTSVGGHVLPAEQIWEAVLREAREELGLTLRTARFLHRYLHRDEREAELVYSHLVRYDGPFTVDSREIEAVRFWSRDEIRRALGTGVLSGNFEDEFGRFEAIREGTEHR
jgi:isopentenyldiphosphate isomerase